MSSKVEAIPDKHPIVVLDAIAHRYGEELAITFSRYKIGPPGDQEKRPRTTLEIRARRVTRAWLSNQLMDLGPDEELALDSRLSIGNTRFHFLMIDYDASCTLPLVRKLGVQILAETRFASPINAAGPLHLYTFETGRCYHQYADLLIPERAWHRYLGNLLLLTLPRKMPIVDFRWIGHSLKREYAALRWSHNTVRYMTMPKLVDLTAAATNEATFEGAGDK